MEKDNTAAQRSLRRLPSVDLVLHALADMPGPPDIKARAAREAIDAARTRAMTGTVVNREDVIARARERLGATQMARLQPVLNATGVLIHTNLGRAPLGDRQLQAVTRIGGGYSNLEYDLGSGTRGSRYEHAVQLITAATGAERALVVNNNAAAVMLALATLCSGREVIISRGELVEIGGEFRIPDVMAAAGARLVEVGTTNRTRIDDYAGAVTPETSALLKVHPANYRIEGFTASVDDAALGKLARDQRLLFLYDVGSGLLRESPRENWTRSEPAADLALARGADIVTFSCDKLLGGPQAGIIAGRSDLIERMRKHPLLRAFRVDKLVLAALEATLLDYLEGRAGELPLWTMARAPSSEVAARAEAVVAAIRGPLEGVGVKLEVVPAGSVAGGGSLPGSELESWAVSLYHPSRSSTDIARALRSGDPPVVGRISEDKVLLDLRTVPLQSDDELASLVVAALAGEEGRD